MHFPFTVRLSGSPGGHPTLAFTTAEGSRTVADDDFKAASGVLVFSATDTLGATDVIVRGDPRLEGDNWFLVRLSNPVGFAFAASEAVGSITNDERPWFAHYWLAATKYTALTNPGAFAESPRVDAHRDATGDPMIEMRATSPSAAVKPRYLDFSSGYFGRYDMREGDQEVEPIGGPIGCALPTSLPGLPDTSNAHQLTFGILDRFRRAHPRESIRS